MGSIRSISAGEEEEIVDYMFKRFIQRYPDIRDVRSNVGHDEDDPHQEYIFSSIDRAALRIIPAKTDLLTTQVRGRIFHTLICRLKLQPINDREDTYESFFLPIDEIEIRPQFEGGDIENYNDRINILLDRVRSVSGKYIETQGEDGIYQILQNIAKSFQSFLIKIEKAHLSKDAINSLKLLLHDKLQSFLHQLGSEATEPIPSVRRILHEALEFLVHD